MISPSRVISLIGLVDSEVMPSHASASIFLSGYLLSPARRSERS